MEHWQEQLTSCLQLLHNEASDESKFVALLLLPRIVDPNNEAAVMQAFNGMNFKFLDRMLRTGHNPNSDVSVELLHSVACEILKAFTNYQKCISSDDMVMRIPALLDCLRRWENPELQDQLLNLLDALASIDQSMVIFFRADIMIQLIRLCELSDDERVLALWLKIHLTALRVIYPKQQETTVASNAPARSELESIFIHSLMDDSLSSLSHILATGNKTKQLQVLESLSVVLNRVDIAPVEDKAVDAKTIANLRSGLMDILSSKIDSKRRFQALSLVAAIIRIYGFNRVMLPSGNDKAKRLLPLTIQLSCIEVRVGLDLVMEALESRTLNEGGKQEDENAQRCKEHSTSELVTVCYMIIEETVQNVTADHSATSASLDIDAVKNIHSALVECFNNIFAYIVQAYSIFSDRDDVLPEPIDFASVRIAAVWLAEEEATSKEIHRLLPIFVQIYRLANADKLTEWQRQLDMRSILTPALLNLTTDSSFQKDFVDAQGANTMIERIKECFNARQDVSSLGEVEVLVNIAVSGFTTQILQACLGWDHAEQLFEPALSRIGHYVATMSEKEILFAVNATLLLLLLERAAHGRNKGASFLSRARALYDACESQKDKIPAAALEVTAIGKQLLDAS
ncbi:hypothetical protein BZG36_01329 [Bifiguratus adelaidae]|uniref:Neurochondrin n=1 Tax=Bifiguratus adelaidae TaxID=1938954 RepID=A0A261Y570_9FUNG|nr:hypothetical protein BZG36_01329 [Bifiguratus adelaidae]